MYHFVAVCLTSVRIGLAQNRHACLGCMEPRFNLLYASRSGPWEKGWDVFRLLLAGWCQDSVSGLPLKSDRHRFWFGIGTVPCMCLCILVQQVLAARCRWVPVWQGLLETGIATIRQLQCQGPYKSEVNHSS